MSETFLGDNFLGVDCSIPIEGMEDSAIMRVQKLTTSTKATMGQTCRGLPSKRSRETRRGGNVYNGGRQELRNYNGDYGNRPRDHYSYS
jgi:hypothetical protein